jgi:hypothetical protein|tara:strand:- start:394 stop:573 length:180 start_codon:yes stop_codon:yes gene_type:complete
MKLLVIFFPIVFSIFGAYVGFAISWFSGDLGYAFAGGVLGLIAGGVFNKLTGITPKKKK